MSLERLGRAPWWTVPLSLATVGAFALAQPLLDLLGKNPEFFIARGLTSTDVIVFPLVLILIPALLSLPVLALRWVGPRASGLAHAIVIGGLFAVFAASALVALFGSDVAPALFGALALAAGVGFAIIFVRFPLVQTAVRYASLALVAFSFWFLAMTPASEIAFASTGDLPQVDQVTNPVPIVMLMFDEFPVATLIDSEGNLIAEQFPNFAQLAEDGVWYRNGVGVRQQTEEALPTILSGVGADPGSIPSSSDHPLNLFTLLSDAYDVAAVETVTNLCPDFACSNSSRRIEPLAERWSALGADLSVVYGHLALPDQISDRLPPIDQTWGNFTTGERSQYDIIDRFLANVDDDRRLEVDRLLDTFEFGEEPALRFGHFLIPHHPWEFTADGRRTGSSGSPGSEGAGWKTDRWLVAQGMQRHILQAQYADTVLGQVMDRMKEEGIYDEALLLITADHGITIRPGIGHQRKITPETVGTIAEVPMFVKYPSGQPGVEPGTIDDTRAETVDLLPTIADVVGIDVPWEVDGLSLLDETRSQRTESTMLGSDGPVTFGVDGHEKLEAAAEKEAMFPDGDPWALAPPGWAGWLGTELADVHNEDVEGVRLTVNQRGTLDALSEDADTLPVFLSGRVNLDTPTSGEEIVMVTVDGVVRAVTRTFEPDGNSSRYQALIHPDLLHPGVNDVEVWLASGTPDQATLLS
jgi:hypothetical protein